MDFATLQTEVYQITGRSDLTAETKSAIKSATLKCHQVDYFPKDIKEVQVNIPSPDYTVQIDLMSLDTLFRSIKYIRKYDVAEGEASDFFEILTPEELLDSYGLERTNVAYLAGTNINIKSSTKDSDMILGYYALPDITDAGFSSWVADQYPYAIIYEASRIVFTSISMPEEARNMARLFAEQIELIHRYSIVDIGN